MRQPSRVLCAIKRTRSQPGGCESVVQGTGPLSAPDAAHRVDGAAVRCGARRLPPVLDCAQEKVCVWGGRQVGGRSLDCALLPVLDYAHEGKKGGMCMLGRISC